MKHWQFLRSLAVNFFIAAIPISASAQTTEQIAPVQAQPADATLAAIHRDSLLGDATLAASQRDSLQNQPKIGKAGANPNQQNIAGAADQFQLQPEPQSAPSEALPALAPAKPQAENQQATASQNQAHRSVAESARPLRLHRTRETKTQNSASSTTATPLLSQLQNQWNRFWHVRSNSKRSDYHPNK
jgi:hypothetical protein